MIAAKAEFQALPGGSRQDPTWAFLSELHALGTRTADQWLAENLMSICVRSTLDMSLFTGLGHGAETGSVAE